MSMNLKETPDELKTTELCLEAVKEKGLALKHVPEALKTEALCLEAVQHSGSALKYVPEALKAIINKQVTGKGKKEE